MRRFRDRRDVGCRLARRLEPYARCRDAIVLGLARGGVPVAYEVAQALEVPLDVFVVRKLGVPGHEELAMGAIASGGVRVANERVVRAIGLPQDAVDAGARRARAARARLPRRSCAGARGRGHRDRSR